MKKQFSTIDKQPPQTLLRQPREAKKRRRPRPPPRRGISVNISNVNSNLSNEIHVSINDPPKTAIPAPPYSK